MASASASDVSGPVARDHRAFAWYFDDLAALDRDPRVLSHGPRHRLAEALAIDRERASGRDAGLVGAADRDRPHAAHLFFQQPHRVRERGAAHRVRAHQLGEPIAGLRGRALVRLHLDEHDGSATLGELIRGLAAGEASTDDRDSRVFDHREGEACASGEEAPASVAASPSSSSSISFL